MVHRKTNARNRIALITESKPNQIDRTQEVTVIDPNNTDSSAIAVIPNEYVQRMVTDRNWTQLTNTLTARTVLEDPLAIWEAYRGLPKNQVYGYAYVAVPSIYYGASPEIEITVPHGMIYIVFLDADLEMYDHALEPHQPRNPRQPVQNKYTRIGKCLWTKKP